MRIWSHLLKKAFMEKFNFCVLHVIDKNNLFRGNANYLLLQSDLLRGS